MPATAWIAAGTASALGVGALAAGATAAASEMPLADTAGNAVASVAD